MLKGPHLHINAPDTSYETFKYRVSYLHLARHGWGETPVGRMSLSQSGRSWTGLSAASIASPSL